MTNAQDLLPRLLSVYLYGSRLLNLHLIDFSTPSRFFHSVTVAGGLSRLSTEFYAPHFVFISSLNVRDGLRLSTLIQFLDSLSCNTESVSLILLMAVSTVTTVVYSLRMVFIRSVASRNLSRSCGSASVENVGRGSGSPESLPFFHLLRRSTLLSAMFSGISIFRSKFTTLHYRLLLDVDIHSRRLPFLLTPVSPIWLRLYLAFTILWKNLPLYCRHWVHSLGGPFLSALSGQWRLL